MNWLIVMPARVLLLRNLVFRGAWRTDWTIYSEITGQAVSLKIASADIEVQTDLARLFLF
jgi:hypothetical protein